MRQRQVSSTAPPFGAASGRRMRAAVPCCPSEPVLLVDALRELSAVLGIGSQA